MNGTDQQQSLSTFNDDLLASVSTTRTGSRLPVNNVKMKQKSHELRSDLVIQSKLHDAANLANICDPNRIRQEQHQTRVRTLRLMLAVVNNDSWKYPSSEQTLGFKL